MLLEDMSISDLDTADDLYLLDASHGETIAAPLPIRYETSTIQNSLTLLCFTTLEAIEWRRHITTAKVGREGSMEAFSKVKENLHLARGGSHSCFDRTYLSAGIW
jgi:hypothetical protein